MSGCKNKNELDVNAAFIAVLIVGVGLFAVGIQFEQAAAAVMGACLIGFALYIIYRQQNQIKKTR